MTKNGEKNTALFRKKRQICQLSAFPGTFEGRAILKHIFEIKFLVYPEIFSLLGAIRDEKMTKNGEKNAALFCKKKTDLPIICLPWQIMAIWRFVLKLIRDFPITDIDKKLFVNWCQFWRREMAKRHCYIVLIFCSSGPSMKPCKKIWAVPQVNIVDFLLKECHNCDVFPAT